mmetsp:Transcript_60279/g.179543  ORF Transcript_60279/g.179543 Transcript_60279/m.179543 type:complete len:115 (+) Transcript_60279:266-610(+)
MGEAAQREPVSVPVAPLGRILQRAGVQVRSLALLKVDCEGCELSLRDDEDVLAALEQWRIPSVVEFHRGAMTGMASEDLLFRRLCGDDQQASIQALAKQSTSLSTAHAMCSRNL